RGRDGDGAGARLRVGTGDHPAAARSARRPGDPRRGARQPCRQTGHAHDGRAHHPPGDRGADAVVGAARHPLCGRCGRGDAADGRDGLATGLTAIAAGAFAIFAYVFGRFDWTKYVGVYFLPGAGELTVFCGALAGAALGFLWFNAHPAQVFMGDTGALAIGGAFGTVAILLKAEFLLLIVGGVFAAETVSVMLQTSVYRWHKTRRGKEYADAHRVFRMAPLHHHFEKLGWAEPQVVMRFYIMGVLCAAIALATLKVR